MNLSKNKRKIVKTADGIPLKQNMKVYFPNVETGEISEHTVFSWHNGETHLILENGKRRFMRIRGQGGAEIYTRQDVENVEPCDALLARKCYFNFNNAQKYIKNYAQKTYRKFKNIYRSTKWNEKFQNSNFHVIEIKL